MTENRARRTKPGENRTRSVFGRKKSRVKYPYVPQPIVGEHGQTQTEVKCFSNAFGNKNAGHVVALCFQQWTFESNRSVVLFVNIP